MEDKYFLSSNGSSGIVAKTKEEILNCIREELDRLEKENPNLVFDIEINSYEEN